MLVRSVLPNPFSVLPMDKGASKNKPNNYTKSRQCDVAAECYNVEEAEQLCIDETDQIYENC
jgi:hypothetical protein